MHMSSYHLYFRLTLSGAVYLYKMFYVQVERREREKNILQVSSSKLNKSCERFLTADTFVSPYILRYLFNLVLKLIQRDGP